MSSGIINILESHLHRHQSWHVFHLISVVYKRELQGAGVQTKLGRHCENILVFLAMVSNALVIPIVLLLNAGHWPWYKISDSNNMAAGHSSQRWNENPFFCVCWLSASAFGAGYTNNVELVFMMGGLLNVYDVGRAVMGRKGDGH